jgi:signal transduction histidine kinase
MGRRAKPVKGKADAKRPLARKSPNDDVGEVRDLEKHLAVALGQLQARDRELAEALEQLAAAHAQVSESLEQQTVTAEILRVISSSPTDIRPVLDAVSENAARLCEASDAQIFRMDGDLLRPAASFGPLPIHTERSISRGWVTGRCVVDRRTIHVHDLAAESEAEFPIGRESQRLYGHRTTLATPLLRGGQPLGAILIRRLEVRPFLDKQIKLLETFADQAVIAIENVRLFKELETRNRDLTTALDQQTATSDILRVISRSQTDVQPVFDAIVDSAMRLLHGISGAVYRLEGHVLHLVAYTSTNETGDAAFRKLFPRPLAEATFQGQSIRERAPYVVSDIESDPRANEQARRVFRARGYRSVVYVPLFKDGVPIGNISVARQEPGTFTNEEVALLQTFADQAVIAIENVRLFTELQEKNTALTAAHAQVTEALDQQTATSEILRTISQSPTDVQPVFDTIMASAVRLCDALFGSLFRVDGELVRLVAVRMPRPEEAAAIYPAPLASELPTCRAIRENRIIHVPDVEAPGAVPAAGLQVARTAEIRSLLIVPMRRDDAPIGAILIARPAVGLFPDEQIALLQTFADQAVIAIENVRLFKELEARTQELTRSVGELRALGEVGQAISSTLDLQTVLSTIVARATQLSGTDAGVIYEYDEQREVFVPRATEGLEATIVDTMLATPVRKGEGATGQLAQVPEPIQLPDILAAPTESRVRGALVRAGYRALLAVPLVREDHLLGGLTVIRKTTGAFAPEVVELLQTFATQSSLAIQNARLFLEIEDKSRQLEAASRHKSEFLANMSHELRTPLNAIIGFSEVLTERMFGELNEKQDEYLKDIYASGPHLLSLINDILDLSKIEAGRMELEPSDFDLPSAIDNALTLVRERAGRRGITLGREIDERVGPIQGDERKVKQVLLNLLSNALKFTPEGGRIDVRAAVSDGMVEVSVADTGVGIAPEDQEAVFEEFRQVGTADKKVEGTGLGLALSRKFIELHGGRIWVKSQVGQGSTFTFTLPVRRGQ